MLLIETSLSSIESMAMFRYLMYKKNIYNMKPRGSPKLLLTLATTPTSISSEVGIRMFNIGLIVGG